MSLEPDSCVRRTEGVFLRYGVRALVFSKFVPGLSTVAPPLAGIVGVTFPRFAAYSSLAALLWERGFPVQPVPSPGPSAPASERLV